MGTAAAMGRFGYVKPVVERVFPLEPEHLYFLRFRVVFQGLAGFARARPPLT
jgi:hypothetical protein